MTADYRTRNAEIVQAYRAGKSLREIGRQFGVCMQRVHQILTERGVPMRPKHVVYTRQRARHA